MIMPLSCTATPTNSPGFVPVGEETRYLVLEFALNYSLYDALIAADKRLDWMTRLNVALDVANGLEYLLGKNLVLGGDVNSSQVLYRDSSRNIRDDFFFDMRKMFHRQCYDYQCIAGCQSLIKSDVYSFGMVFLELLTGKYIQSESFRLSVSPKLGKSKLHTILDPATSNGEGANNMEFRPKIIFFVRRLEAMCEVFASDGCKGATENPDVNNEEKERVVVEMMKEALDDESGWSFLDKKKEVYQKTKFKLCGYVAKCD